MSQGNIRSVLLVTSNGFGMGHLVRQLAIKAAMPVDVRCTILTLSGAAPIAISAGAIMEYCPSYTKFAKRPWHRGYLADRIEALAREVDADLVLFDGVVPYAGLLSALDRLDVTRVWMRRGVWRNSAKRWPLAYSGLFDLILEPADIGSRCDTGPTAGRNDAVSVGVVTQAGGCAMLSREEAARFLGVDPSKPTLLLNIGSNRIADLDAFEREVAGRTDWNIITTRDALGRNRSGSTGIRVISGVFPLHRYLAAVDLAVTSVGYNAAHEFLACGVPTVVVPADNATDDQHARADAMEVVGASIVARLQTGPALRELVIGLMDNRQRREEMRAAALAAISSTGAPDAVNAILASVRKPHSAGAVLRHRIRMLVELVLGPFTAGDHRPALFSDSISMQDVQSEQRIEHLHPGLSTTYRSRRQEIAARW